MSNRGMSPFAGCTIDHVIPNLTPGDGASDACLAFRSLLIDAGAESQIWAESIHPRRCEFASRFDIPSIRRRAPDLLIVHYTTGSDVNIEIAAAKMKFVVFYHNVTPAEFFIGVNDRLAGTAWRGIAELPQLLRKAQLVLCASQHSADDVRRAGRPDAVVIPIPVNGGAGTIVPDQQIMRRYNDGVPMVLFVGRLAPNKRQHELLSVFHRLQRCFDQRVRLVFVGSDAASPEYRLELQRLIHTWRLTNVDMPGYVTPEARAAYVQCASVYLSLSKHEGFGIPLIEAMQAGVPIIARNSTAVGETIGKGGLVIESYDPVWLAAMVAEVIENQGLRQSLIAAGQLRGEELRPSNIAPRFLNAIAPILGVALQHAAVPSARLVKATHS